MSTVPRFGPEGLKFLRALKRNNRREWFSLANRSTNSTSASR